MSGYADNLVLKGEMYEEKRRYHGAAPSIPEWGIWFWTDKSYGFMGEHERPWVYNELKVFFCIISNEFIKIIKICMKLDY